MGNFSTSGLKELFEDIPRDVDKGNDVPDYNTPNRLALVDPRSPLGEAQRTPIEVIRKSSLATQIINREKVEEKEETESEESPLHHKRQLDDPRSATAGIPRTPIVVESPIQQACETPKPVNEKADVQDEAPSEQLLTSTPVQVSDMQQKVTAVAKKLTFDMSPSPVKTKGATASSPARNRTPLGHVQGNNVAKPCTDSRQKRRPVSKGKPQGPMSPLQLLHIRQRLAVKRALQLTRGEAENCHSAVTEDPQAADERHRSASRPIVAVGSVTKDPTLRL